MDREVPAEAAEGGTDGVAAEGDGVAARGGTDREVPAEAVEGGADGVAVVDVVAAEPDSERARLA